MKILKQEVIVYHNGQVFKRIYEHDIKRLSWQLFQHTEEAEIWTTMPEVPSAILSKAFIDCVSTQKPA